MFRKFKSVVVFFKILVTLVLSRPFGNAISKDMYIYLKVPDFSVVYHVVF